MAKTLVAGVDTSTQSCKVRVTDAETGELVRFGQAKHPNGTSIDPAYWWDAFQEAAQQAGGLDDVSALAVGGQQHGMVILDGQGNVIRDAMLWNDTSSAPQAAALIEKLGAAPAQNGEPEDPIARGKQRWVKAVGSSPVASYTLTKVAWVAENEPENAKKIAAICLPHDWLSWRIAGYGPVAEGEDAHLDALFTDRSDASGTIYYDAARNEYRRDLIAMVLEAAEGAEAAQAHADAIVLPTVLGPREAAPVKADPAIAGKSVEGGCALAPGGGDNAMASLGLGMSVGDVSVSLGTSGVAAGKKARRLVFDKLIIDMDAFELTVDGKKVDTPPKEMELLYYLASSPNRVYTRNQLLDEVWGFDYFGDSRTVDVHVKRLREKLEGVSDQWSLKTVWGVGYKFEVL